MKAIIVSFDRLPVSFLGCYGNEWIETPHFDRLAVEATLFERHFAENVDPAAASNAWWTGCYSFPRDAAQLAASRPLPDMLREVGVRMHLLCEGPASESTAGCEAFDEIEKIEKIEGDDGFDAEPRETPFARLAERASQCAAELNEDADSWLLWIKSRGVPTAAIPPSPFAELYFDRLPELYEILRGGAESESMPSGGLQGHDAQRAPGQGTSDEDDDHEEDQEPSDAEQLAAELKRLLPAVKSILKAAETDDEEFLSADRAGRSSRAPGTGDEAAAAGDVQIEEALLAARCIYAGYVTMLDHWLGKLLERVRELGDDVLLLVTAAAGSPLLGKAALSEVPARMHGSVIHVPLLVRVPGVEGGSRQQVLAQSVDVYATLAAHFGVSAEAAPCEGHNLLPIIRNQTTDPVRQSVCLGDGGYRAIRTDEAYLVEGVEGPPMSEADEQSQPLPEAEPTEHSKPMGTGGESATPAEDEPGREATTEPARRWLFLKPEDIWEINECSEQYADETERLAGTLRRFVEAAGSRLPADFPELEPPAGVHAMDEPSADDRNR